MDKIIITIFKIISYIIIIVGVIFFVLVLINGDILETDLALQDRILNPFFNLTFLALIIAAAATLIFPLIWSFTNITGKKIIKTVILLVVFAVIIYISYSLSNNTFNAEDMQRLKTTERESRVVGAGLILTYIVAGLTVLSLVFSSVINFFRR